jgi:DNA-binding NtrC family response regulator
MRRRSRAGGKSPNAQAPKTAARKSRIAPKPLRSSSDGMSGLELLPKAKAVRPDVPVIMITAYGDAETKRKAFEGGAEALLTKPIDFVSLRNEIDTRVEQAA